MSTSEQAGAVVVGVDGSAGADRAVLWAAAHAQLHDAPLRIVVGRGRTRLHDRRPSPVPEWLATASHLAGAGVRVTEVAVSGDPVEVLVDESGSARTVVVGDRGGGRAAGLAAGSVAVGVLSAARCPVVVVRGGVRVARELQPVVVAVDGSGEAEGPLAFAFGEAAARHVPLVAVHTWWEGLYNPALARLVDWRAYIADERRYLAEVVTPWARKHPDVAVRQVVERARPVHALRTAAATAQLVVTGSHRHGELTGLLLGSVSNALVHTAACPVAVVPPA